VTDWDDPAASARTMWGLFEPLHAVAYFTPEPRAAFEQVGLRGYWRGYFAGRAAPLGPVGPSPVVAAFFGFAPSMVARAVPDVWSRATPEVALEARAAGARATLTRLLGTVDLANAAGLIRRAAEAADLLGRPLAAANAELPWSDDPLDVLWQAATLLREHRGDGHIAALLVAGLNGCESVVWRSAVDNDRGLLQPGRGWSDEEWNMAGKRLIARGWLDGGGYPTGLSIIARDQIEATTDTLAAAPWRALGPGDTARLAALLRPLAVAASADLPFPNPGGVPRPTSDA
jgi:hypothetical protein